MKPLIALLLLTALAPALPPKRVTNREFPDGSGSSKETDPVKRQAFETFFASDRTITHKVLYQLDERTQPISAIYYDPKGRILQKVAYKLDAADRIAQEVIYDPKGNLLFTKNYTFGTREGRTVIIAIDTYDQNGNLIQPAKGSKPARKPR